MEIIIGFLLLWVIVGVAIMMKGYKDCDMQLISTGRLIDYFCAIGIMITSLLAFL